MLLALGLHAHLPTLGFPRDVRCDIISHFCRYYVQILLTTIAAATIFSLMTNAPAPRTPFVPTPQPELVAYLRDLLERAEAGEVQFLIASAGVTPAGEPTGFDVRAHVALGDRVPRYAPPARRAVYASVLEGLERGASTLDRNFKAITPDILLPA